VPASPAPTATCPTCARAHRRSATTGSAAPLLNINRACQTCHRYPEDELKVRVETIQARTAALRNDAMDALIGLISDLQRAAGAGKSDADLGDRPRALQRRAQFMLDYVEAENSTGFHAPQEAARILGESINLSRQGQIAVRDPGYKPEAVPAGMVTNVSRMIAATRSAGPLERSQRAAQRFQISCRQANYSAVSNPPAVIFTG